MLRLLFFASLFLLSCDSGEGWTCKGDCENGKGTKLWNDGGYEKGKWKNGKLNGHGRQYFGSTSEFSGDTYEGEFKNDLYHGYGVYYDKSEDSKYSGEFKIGMPDGKGKATWGKDSKYPNRYYDGEWKLGLMHGYGTKFWGQAEVAQYTNNKYTGEWKNDEMDGEGKYEWADGSYYQGPWKNGDQHGKGVYVFPDGEVFEGFWIEGYCPELAQKLSLE
ncbi:MAG: hypothetical protein ACFHU9_00550 [Fluviicola sp.]